MHPPKGRSNKAPTRAFTFTELVAVLGAIALLALIVLPVLARDADSSERGVCLNNMKHIMAAVVIYSTDNNDFLPHPSWGAILTGPDNWCYATANRGRDTELPVNASATTLANCTGQSETSIQFSNQVRFFKIGQLARFLENQRVLVCPSDWRESMGGKRSLYLSRAVKLTSYTMNATVGGYVGPRCCKLISGVTYKTSDFLPTDILVWEQNDSDPFYFNDAANNPEGFGEALSRRHATANGEGLGVVGRAGATADFMKWGAFTKLQIFRGQANELLCGPGYQ